MGRYVFKRILLALVSIFIICLITFFAMNAIPGGPFNSEKALSAATKAALEARYNLDKPVHIQFILYMRNLLHGDFGVSLKTGREISTTLSSCFKVSAWQRCSATDGRTESSYSSPLCLQLCLPSSLRRSFFWYSVSN